MFHVSTLLPYSKIERQQLERKRHIGNDIVAIIFQENETTFSPECITSQFLHVYLIITPLDTHGTRFKVSVIHRDSVPTFGPIINYSNIFHYDNIFKQWLLTKLINAETASFRSSSFQKYQVRNLMRRSYISSFEKIGTNKNEFIRKFISYITRSKSSIYEFYFKS
jgi:RAP1 GTPase activating protein 1